MEFVELIDHSVQEPGGFWAVAGRDLKKGEQLLTADFSQVHLRSDPPISSQRPVPAEK